MLYIVATPIGHPKDISLRALEVLRAAEIIIGEERRMASTLLKKLEVTGKELYLLNEHSTKDDVEELLNLCKKHSVALISDCGTPSFYDPGYQLIRFCRNANISVTAVPGASSLMTLLSLVSEKVTQFYFAGFLSADSEVRPHQFQKLQTLDDAIVLMDTPYRLLKLMGELDVTFGPRKLLLGINLTHDQELVLEGTPKELLNVLHSQKIDRAEFILIIYARTKKETAVGPKAARPRPIAPNRVKPKSKSWR
jgi:16S rRNA (cytidine1402-2'-O)-methyltransferase